MTFGKYRKDKYFYNGKKYSHTIHDVLSEK